ncbi:hypothetical protein BBJ29_004171 [Phytophthora kernoviae]|uniref:Uncharacterized protein n=1 Tax=Phytophthora kernoviae TaxID=325452 RepID=A0A3F2S4C3_9STRA|nr:hypothetical protein BBJ29_004171 [Phytophthora kernoviae]RLN69234.1 hypothetical protein BBP00_00000520 [Phytophthora kernoviae]
MLQNAGIPTAVASLETDNEIQERIARFLRVQRERGQDFQTTLQDKKERQRPNFWIFEQIPRRRNEGHSDRSGASSAEDTSIPVLPTVPPFSGYSARARSILE